jgi:coenzyme F420-reducing hydrogenase delta subunit
MLRRGGGSVTDDFEPKILMILCNWCSYAGADLAGTSRLQYPPNTRTVRVMCTGRVNPQFIIKALQEGADGVLVSGCHPGECHYETGNILARRKFLLTREILDFIGIDGRRFQVSWVSASEGPKFQDVVARFVSQITELGPQDRIKRRDIIE